MHYVDRNDWKRPSQAQVEAIAAEEIKRVIRHERINCKTHEQTN